MLLAALPALFHDCYILAHGEFESVMREQKASRRFRANACDIALQQAIGIGRELETQRKALFGKDQEEEIASLDKASSELQEYKVVGNADELDDAV